MDNLERSCGAVVFTRKEGRPLFVIVREMAGAYSFPKWHREGNDTEEETARREIFEATGLRPSFLPGFREQDEYDLAERPGFRKRVTYFLAEFEGGPLTPRPGEIREILLLPYEQAVTYFEHESSRRILSAAYAFLTA